MHKMKKKKKTKRVKHFYYQSNNNNSLKEIEKEIASLRHENYGDAFICNFSSYNP